MYEEQEAGEDNQDANNNEEHDCVSENDDIE